MNAIIWWSTSNGVNSKEDYPMMLKDLAKRKPHNMIFYPFETKRADGPSYALVTLLRFPALMVIT
jgi:hypothetical protein